LIIARVVGNTWATRKHPSLERCKLLLIRQFDPVKNKYIGKTMLAVDCKIDAGMGDIVLVMDEGNSARQIMDDKTAPVRTIIAGVIDEIVIGKNRIKCH